MGLPPPFVLLCYYHYTLLPLVGYTSVGYTWNTTRVSHCNTLVLLRQILNRRGSEDLENCLYNIVMKRASKKQLSSYSCSSNVAMIRMMNQDQAMKDHIVDLLKLIIDDPDDQDDPDEG